MKWVFILPRADSPSIRQPPAASFQAVFFAKPASVPVYLPVPTQTAFATAPTGCKKVSNPQYITKKKAIRELLLG